MPASISLDILSHNLPSSKNVVPGAAPRARLLRAQAATDAHDAYPPVALALIYSTLMSSYDAMHYVFHALGEAVPHELQGAMP